MLSRKFQNFDSYRFYETRMIGTYFADMLAAMLKNTGIIRREYERALRTLVLSLPAKLLRRSTIAIREASREIIARFPVYRSYIGEEGPHPEDRRLIDTTIASAQRHNGARPFGARIHCLDFSLVDSDNRRPVDFMACQRALNRRESVNRLGFS